MGATNYIAEKRKRDRWKRKGLCTHCCKEREIDTRLYCQKCTDINKAYRDKKKVGGVHSE